MTKIERIKVRDLVISILIDTMNELPTGFAKYFESLLPEMFTLPNVLSWLRFSISLTKCHEECRDRGPIYNRFVNKVY